MAAISLANSLRSATKGCDQAVVPFALRVEKRLRAPGLFKTLWGALVCALVLFLAQRPAQAQDTKKRYFYQGYDYGTQALYNPLYVFINGAYDVLQIRAGQRDIFRKNYYTSDMSNVAENLFVHPLQSVSEEGWTKFLRQEILPLSFTSKTSRWVPNYTLHLLGGGMTHRALWEWYEAHGVPAPWLAAAATRMGYAFLNEAVENKGIVGRNTDCIADFWVFDLVGIALFSFESVDRFFSETFIISDWSLQPSFTLPKGDLHNQGQYFAGKFPLPFYRKLSLFFWGGMAQMGGLSFKADSQYSFTVAAGTMSTRLANPLSSSVHNTVEFKPSGALFLDRKESLLAMVQLSDIEDYFLLMNVYPNAFWRTRPGVGLWSAVDKEGRFVVGMSLSLLGLGAGYSFF